MKNRWFISLFASIPVVAAVLALQSCGGVGGPTTINGGGQGSITEQFLALLSDEQRTAKSITPEECADCHGGRNPDDPIYAHWKDTKHFEKGVKCESCHGPGSAHKANPTKTNILTLPKAGSPVVCAQCHGPIADQFSFSQHSKLIADPVEEAILDPARYGRSSRCIACHSGLVRAEIESGVDLATLTDDQIKELAEETLTTLPYSADCISCHDPHKKTDNLNQNGKQAQLRKPIFNTDVTAIGPGKTAAEFTTYNHTCGQCHNGRGTNPADARLEAGTARPSMHDSNQMQMLMGFGGVDGVGPIQSNTAHAQAPGQCVKCHMPDSRHTFTVSFDKGCAPCHTSADAAARTSSIKSEILEKLVALKTRMEGWANGKFGNSSYWDYTSVITAEGGTPPPQDQVNIEVKRARHNYYFVIRSGDYGVHNAPYAKHLITVANTNLDALGVPKPPPSKMSTDEKFRLIEAVKAQANRAEFQGNN